MIFRNPTGTYVYLNSAKVRCNVLRPRSASRFSSRQQAEKALGSLEGLEEYASPEVAPMPPLFYVLLKEGLASGEIHNCYFPPGVISHGVWELEKGVQWTVREFENIVKEHPEAKVISAEEAQKLCEEYKKKWDKINKFPDSYEEWACPYNTD